MPKSFDQPQKQTPSERQAAWRHRALVDPDGLNRTRFQLFLSAQATTTLLALVQKTGWTKRRVVEEALEELGKRFHV
ncbi:hypothetical protein H7F10_06980 [Acidithiobacillus sp. HP-6]|uniref:hypothetical protein n=1 Tax=unclassified Acidithiobacillus TaxID=2614800 RepID=UPI0018792BE2|nr:MULTISPECIES: hypothetical protein [unclassified Acidithiobacillus]MBE7562698.1 hypothetical protein [Acidithiobacillus sp. HP-6]MBE7570506.1 hypothetical protein [Acidithiobacillus sp. HP-2]